MNFVNINLLIEKIEEVVRTDLKELVNIKDVNLAEIVGENFKCLQDLVVDLVINKEDPDATPVFDFEM